MKKIENVELVFSCLIVFFSFVWILFILMFFALDEKQSEKKRAYCEKKLEEKRLKK
jgi:hypothetical protein